MHFVDLCCGEADNQPSAAMNRYTYRPRLRVFVELASQSQPIDLFSPMQNTSEEAIDRAYITPVRFLFSGSEEDDFGPSPTTIIDVENSNSFSRYRSQKDSQLIEGSSRISNELSRLRSEKEVCENEFELMNLFAHR